MTDQDILRAAAQKAIDNGWSGYMSLVRAEITKTAPDTVSLKKWIEFVDEAQTELGLSYKEIIFNHDFARALWGDEECPYDTFSKRTGPSGSGGPAEDWYDGATWEFHLQQMVTAEDPIKYLQHAI